MKPEKPERKTFRSWSETLKALAHPTRLMIVDELLKNPRCVTAIHEILDVRQPNISQHLNILRSSGLVESGRDGAYRCYYLRQPDFVRSLLEALGKDWPESNIEEVRKRFKTALKERNTEKENRKES